MLGLILGACGGGSANLTPAAPVIAAAANVAPLVVDSGPAGSINTVFVTVTLCAPGGTQCQSIDHVSVDTGSSGLRILAAALTAPEAFPARHDAGGTPLAECMQFADGYSWGPVRSADVQIAGETASSLPVQIIGDASFAAVPSDCASLGLAAENTVQAFGANGVLGVGTFREDCGSACAAASSPTLYYSCPVTGCVAAIGGVGLADQVQNPVWQFSTDNNGLIVQLPAVGPAGAAQVNGSLIFGIDTQSNNTLGTATVLKVDGITGSFPTLYNSQTYTQSLFDSGSSAYFFPDAGIATCTSGLALGYYCPASLQSLSATVQGTGTSITGTVSFSVANANALVGSTPTFTAYRSLGAPNPLGTTYFTWGLPFFYGRYVLVAIEGQPTSAGPGPYFAYR